MNRRNLHSFAAPAVLAAAILVGPVLAEAGIDGLEVTGPVDLYARTDFVTSADGASLLIWGLTDQQEDGLAQYPAPTLILNQGQAVTITVHNELGGTDNTSLVFPGHDVTSCSGTPGVLTCEALPGSSASYNFEATHAGTYMYHAGTDAALQVELGIVGAIIVRPFGYDALNPTAYGHPDSAYDREYLFMLSEMDSRIHQAVEFGDPLAGTEMLGDYFSNYWFINGRTGPDTMAASGVPWLPTQPYNSLPQIHPGERMLMRVISAGRDLHPFHHHGNHARLIARDGRMLSSAPGAGADLSFEVFTIQALPGESYDAIFQWSGKDLGWDIYGSLAQGKSFNHSCNGIELADCETANPNDQNPACQSAGFDPDTHEYCGDHGKDFPVVMPENLDLTFGGFWSGSPFFGASGALPPGEGGLNPNSGYTFMWHSHTEKELTNNDIFPGGMLTMLIIEPSWAPID